MICIKQSWNFLHLYTMKVRLTYIQISHTHLWAILIFPSWKYKEFTLFWYILDEILTVQQSTYQHIGFAVVQNIDTGLAMSTLRHGPYSHLIFTWRWSFKQNAWKNLPIEAEYTVNLKTENCVFQELLPVVTLNIQHKNFKLYKH